MKPVYWILTGLAAVGLITLAVATDQDEEDKDTDNKKDNEVSPSKPEYDVDEIRRLRRELRKQTKLKKTAERTKNPVGTSTRKT